MHYLIRKPIFFIGIILLFSLNASAEQKRKKIITSIPPIASLIQMISGDRYDVDVIINQPFCPHHYIVKPSQLRSIKKADLVILLSKDFEKSIYKILYKNSLDFFEIMENPIFDNEDNYHIWVSVNNAKKISQIIAKYLISKSRDKKEVSYFKSNLKNTLNELDKLKFKTSNNKLAFIGCSLYYLKDDITNNNLYIERANSLKKLNDQRDMLLDYEPKCLYYDDSIRASYLKNLYQGKIQKIEVENWKSRNDYKNYYIDYMKKIKNSVLKCSK